MSNNTGGPAFPQVDLKNSYGMLVPDRQAGMSMRDYFAAKAMQALIEKYDKSPVEIGLEEISLEAYEFADAMLKAREDNNGS